MVMKKKAFSKVPVNIAAERLKLQNERQIAIETHGIHSSIVAELDAKILEFEELKQENEDSFHNSKMGMFAKLNNKNREANLMLGREAEKAANADKKNKSALEYDPFARRKTAPSHVVK